MFYNTMIITKEKAYKLIDNLRQGIKETEGNFITLKRSEGKEMDFVLLNTSEIKFQNEE